MERERKPLTQEEKILGRLTIMNSVLTHEMDTNKIDLEVLSVIRTDANGRTKLNIECIWPGDEKISTLEYECETQKVEYYLEEYAGDKID